MNKSDAGNMIRTARRKAGLTQVALARKLNVTQAAVGCWEIGRSIPRPETLATLCKLLEIPVEKLLKAG